MNIPVSTPVKFMFRNLGPIEEAELELGNLTIIAGRNNTGKTYLAYTLYGFLKAWNSWPGAENYFLSGDLSTKTAGIISETVAEGHARRKADRATLSQEREELIPILTQDFSESFLANVFSAPEEAFKGATVGVDIGSGFPDIQQVKIDIRGDKEFTLEYDGEEIHMYCSDPEKDSTDEFWLSRLYLRFLLLDLFDNPFVLCAERFGISLFFKELDFNKNRLVDFLQKMGDDKSRDSLSFFDLIESTTGRYALPIKDNIDFTRDLSDIQKERSALYDSKLFDDIRGIMAGYYRSSDDEIRFISRARKNRSFDIPLHRASSSARGLSDLYFYLKHVAQRKDLLIIDEPESHLDTANQIQFARLLSRVVRAGVKVLITTHSDYLIKEINNLIMLNSYIEKKGRVARKLKYKKNDSLPAELVRAYVAEDNSLKACTIDEFGIDLPFLDSTIDDISKSSNELATFLAREGVE